MYFLYGKYDEIVDLVFKYRFINRYQIQRALHHKGPRRINSWLKELTEEGFLGRIYSNKLLENTKPAIYYLSYKGISVVKEGRKLSVSEVKKFYEDKKRSQTFIDHCVSVAELLTKLKEKDDELRKYNIFTREQLRKHKYLSELKPDAYVEVYRKKNKKDKETFTASFFMDLIDPGVPRYAIRYRIKQYIQYHEDEEWKEFLKEFPGIVLIFPTAQKQRQIGKHIQKELTEGLFTQGMHFMLTTIDKAIENGLVTGILQEIKE